MFISANSLYKLKSTINIVYNLSFISYKQLPFQLYFILLELSRTNYVQLYLEISKLSTAENASSCYCMKDLHEVTILISINTFDIINR